MMHMMMHDGYSLPLLAGYDVVVVILAGCHGGPGSR